MTHVVFSSAYSQRDIRSFKRIIIDCIMSNKDYFSFLSYYSSEVYREDSTEPRYHYPLGTM